MVAEFDRIESQKPRSRAGEFDDVSRNKDGDLVVQNARYSSRIRHSKTVSVALCKGLLSLSDL